VNTRELVPTDVRLALAVWRGVAVPAPGVPSPDGPNSVFVLSTNPR
jgi:hypothetical protein